MNTKHSGGRFSALIAGSPLKTLKAVATATGIPMASLRRAVVGNNRMVSRDRLQAISEAIGCDLQTIIDAHHADLVDIRQNTDGMENARIGWTDEMDQTLANLHANGTSLSVAARILGVGYGQAWRRANKLSLVFAVESREESSRRTLEFLEQCRPERARMSEKDIDALYAQFGGYGDDTSRPGTSDPVPMRSGPAIAHSHGSAASQCAEF